MNRKIVIAGGSGFIGRYLDRRFRDLGYEVRTIGRYTGDALWTHPERIASILEDTDLLINLAGKSVNCRYNEKNRLEILESRVSTTMLLGKAILQCKTPPALWINSSTATIYRHAEDRPMTETAGEIGSGFSVDVATQWEKAFFSFRLPDTRQVALRTAIVLGPDGGMLKPMLNLVRFGLGGRQGNGRQMFSWIHIEDLFGIVFFVMDHRALHGVYNCSSPNPVTNNELMSTLKKQKKAIIGLPSPAWLLEIGAVLIKTETELILKSRWVLPEKLLQAGYEFKFPGLEQALINLKI